MGDAEPRILIVDDDPTISKLLMLVLEQAGFRAVGAPTGEAAYRLATTEKFDLAILDVMLPGMDGYTLCRKLRQTPSTSLMPILILTAQGDTRDKLAGFNAGADDYLTKPFEPMELGYRVKALLARSQPQPAGAKLRTQRGQLWTVFGAKGGVGKTTLAVNVAVELAKDPNLRVVLVDADFAFGDIGAHLNLSPSRTILDLVPRVDDMDEELLRQVLIRHESNVRVLLAPYRPEDEERISAEAVQKIVDMLVSVSDYVIADCAASYDDRTLNLLEHADQIIMVLTPEMGPVKNTSTFLDLARQLGIPAHRIHVVLNRADSAVGVAAAEIEHALQKEIPLRLVSGGRPIVLSANRGVPIVLDQPLYPFSQQIMRVVDTVRAASHTDTT